MGDDLQEEPWQSVRDDELRVKEAEVLRERLELSTELPLLARQTSHDI